MKRTILVLALAVLSCAGCRAISPQGGVGCGDACAAPSCGEPCQVARSRNAPRPVACGDTCHCDGNLEQNCPGGNGCCFDRYAGSQCGPGYHPGPYDCSPCGSPNWGCNGHRHPSGYVDGQRCLCDCPQGNCQQCAYQQCGECPQVGPHGLCANHGYCCACCGPPAPGGECCPCGPSGDHNYNFNPGPPVGQTAYPYYTLRGPRDFLLNNPPSIGPY